MLIKLLKRILAFLERKKGKAIVDSLETKIVAHPDFVDAIGRGEIDAVPKLDFIGKDGKRYQYHLFGNMGQDIAYIRLDQAREFEFQHGEYGLTKALLSERLKRIMVANDVVRFESYNEVDYRTAATEVFNMAALCQQSLAFGSPIDKMLDVMSCLYIEKNESPYTYNRHLNLEKIRVWMENYDVVSAFFLQNPFMSMFDFATLSQSDSLSVMLSKIPKEGEELEKWILQRMHLLGDLNEKTKDGTSEMFFRHTTMLSRIELNEQLRLNFINSSE